MSEDYRQAMKPTDEPTSCTFVWMTLVLGGMVVYALYVMWMMAQG